MAKKDKYVKFSGVSLSGYLDIKDDKLFVMVEDTEVDIMEILEENVGCSIKIDISFVEDVAND